MRRVDITGIALEANTGAPLVVLREQDEPHRLLPIFIGPPEASAIAIAAAGQKAPVPMVHDVMAALVASLEGRIERVEVTDLHEGTYLAAISVSGPGGSRRVGSRPSDALALAVRTGAPVFVSDAVMDEAGGLPNADDRLDGDEPATLDASEIEAEVDSFRSFLDDVSASDFIDVDTVDDAIDDTDTNGTGTDTGAVDDDGVDPGDDVT